MGKNDRQDQDTTSRKAKKEQFISQQEQAQIGMPAGVLVVGILMIAALIAGAFFVMTGPSGQAARPSIRIISDAAERPSAQAIAGEGAGSQGVRAATLGHDPYPPAVAQDGLVSIPLSTVSDHEAHYYTYMHEGEPIEFFVLESSDGTVRAAFNACDVCFQSKKGYTRDGDEVICNNCGLRFPAERINEVRGGCNPSPLDRTIQDDSLLIRAEDIVGGLRYF